MKPAIDIGRMFRMAVQKETAERGHRGRLTEEVIEDTEAFKGFRENSLALNRHNHQNIRLPGRSPQVMFEDQGGVSIREIASETILNRDGSPLGEMGVMSLFGDGNERVLAKEMQTSFVAGRLREAGAETSAMDFTMFQMLVGQLLINSTLKGFENEEFILSQAAGIYPTEFITGEIIPGISTPLIKDTMGQTPGQTGVVRNTLLHKPGEEFKKASAAENYIRLPATEEHGVIIGFDRTAILHDRTGLISSIASGLGEELGAEKEMMGLDMLIGVPNAQAPYMEKYAWDDADVQIDPYQAGNTTLNNGSYQLAGSTYKNRPFPFVNDVDYNPLNDWHAFQRSDIFQSKLVNPNNGRPITLGKFPTLFAPYSTRFNIAKVVEHHSQWMITQIPGLAPGTTIEMGPNLINSQLGRVIPQVSKLLRQRMVLSGLYGDAAPVQVPSIAGTTGSGVIADYVWFYGDLKEALKFNQNWGIKTIQAPENSEAAFSQGINFRWRSDYKGVWAWHNPRKIQRCNYLNQGAILDFQPSQT